MPDCAERELVLCYGMASDDEKLMILMAEDDQTDRKLLGLAVAQDGIPAKLFIVPDGEDVVRYLRGEGQYAESAGISFS